MKKKYIVGTLFLLLLAISSCGKAEQKATPKPTEETVTVTDAPEEEALLPTPDAEITEAEDGTNQYENASAHYSISYDPSQLQLENKNNIDYFTPADEKAAKEANLFLDIVNIENGTMKEMKKQIETSYKKQFDKATVKIGADQTSSVCYTIKGEKKMRHQMYLVKGSDTLSLIELKCPKKYEDTYGAYMDQILETISFHS